MPSSANKVRYSDREQSFLALLPADGKRINSEELLARYYGNKSKPFYARQIIIATMRGLMKKTMRNKEDFIIRKSKRAGPRPMEFWKEKRNGT